MTEKTAVNLVATYCLLSMIIIASIWYSLDNGMLLLNSFIPGTVDDIFVPYIKEFEREYGKPLEPMRVKMVDTLGNGAEGLTIPVGHRAIYISNRYWRLLDACQKEALIFHEAGHAWLNRMHDDVMLPNGAPRSIMNSYVNDAFACDSFYGKNREYYIKELFNGYR